MKRGTPTHPKTLSLADRMSIMPCFAVGILEGLWHMTGQFAVAGDIGRYDNAAIARGIGYMGDSNALIAALVASRFLDESPTHRLVVHDWHDHCEDSIHQRLARSRQFFASGDVPNYRRLVKSEQEEAHKFYVSRTIGTPILPLAESGTLKVPLAAEGCLPSQAIALAKPTSCTEPKTASASVPDESPVLMEYDVIGKIKGPWKLTQKQVDTFKGLYPHTDIMAECKKAWGWLDATPRNRKTFDGMKKFLNGWLSRATNTGASRNGPSTQNPKAPSGGAGHWNQKYIDDLRETERLFALTPVQSCIPDVGEDEAGVLSDDRIDAPY